MIRALLFSFLFFATPAFALNGDGCETRLEKRDVPSEVREAFAFIHKIAPGLMADVYEGKIKVERRRRWTRFQEAVSGRYSKFLGRKLLIVREIDTASEKAKQKFIWDVAQALFELQMEPWLWSKDSLSAGKLAVDALNVGEDEDAFAYFALQMPKEWRDHYLTKAETLLSQRYLLAMVLPELEAKDLMEAERPKSGFAGLLVKSGAAPVEPNLQDFEIFKHHGFVGVEAAVGKTYEKALLAKYYFNHARRMLIGSFVVSTLALTPYLLEIPSYFEAQGELAKYEENLHKSPERANSVQLRLLDQRRMAEIERLKNQIASEEKKDLRDESLLNQLRLELQQNLERSPGAVFTTDAREKRENH